MLCTDRELSPSTDCPWLLLKCTSRHYAGKQGEENGTLLPSIQLWHNRNTAYLFPESGERDCFLHEKRQELVGSCGKQAVCIGKKA